MLCRGWMVRFSFSGQSLEDHNAPLSFFQGVCHAEDVVFVFGIPQRLRGIAFTEDEAKLSRDMISSWTMFARSGTTGKISDVTWEEAVDRTNLNGPARMLEIGDTYRMVDGVYKTTCDAFWKPRIFV